MSAPINAITPALFGNTPAVTFTAAHTTIAQVVAEPDVGAAALAPYPAFYGGNAVLEALLCSSDSVTRDVQFWEGQARTTQSTGATGNITLTLQNKLSRTAGSWIADGWKVGMLVMAFVPAGSEQSTTGLDGILGIVTAVTALALTVNGSPWASGTHSLAAGTRIAQVAPLARISVTASAGVSPSVPAVNLIGNASNGCQVENELKLGDRDLLIANLPVAVSALPAYLTIHLKRAKY